MAYIGNRPEQGNFRKCDAITTSATATYNLLVGGVAVNPNQNQCIVSLNGVIQSSGNSYTIASSQITFASTLASSDVIDFILILGDTLDVGVPSDDTVDASKITANIITGQSALGATPADTDELLISDAGVLKRVDYSYLKGGDNTPMWFVRKTSDQALSDNSYTKVTWNSEVIDTDSAFASDKFTVPSGKAGKYYISTGVGFYDNSTQEYHYVLIYKNGSNVSADPSGITTTEDNTDRYWQTNNMILDLAVSDYVEVYVLCKYTSGTGTMNSSYFTGYKLIT